MLFGRTLFAGALVAGIVTATGVGAVATAQASAAAAVVFKGKGSAVAQANAQALALRMHYPTPLLAGASASATGQSKVAFFLEGSALAQALAQSKEIAWYFGSSTASAGAVASAKAFKRVRSKTQPPAKAYAEADADPQIYFLAKGTTAFLRAFAVGTTDYVGRGTAHATATALVNAEKAIGVRQNASGFSYGEGVAVTIAGGIGNGRATATGWADAAVIRAGVREFEVFGHLSVTADAHCSHVVVFQPQAAKSNAVLSAKPVHIRGAKGTAAARAIGQGDGSLVQTGVFGAPAVVTANAQARASKITRGQAHAQTTASAVGRARLSANAKGTALTSAWLKASGLSLALRVSAMASGMAHASATRIRYASSSIVATAEATGFNQINDLTKAPAGRTYLVQAETRRFTVEAQPRLIFVEA